MYIHDDEWDFFVSECIQLTDLINSISKSIGYPHRKEILWILYVIIHMEDQAVPGKRRKGRKPKSLITKNSTLIENQE